MGNQAKILSRTFSVRSIIFLSISLFLAVVSPLISASPASAAVSAQHSCSGNAVCLYEHRDFGGSSYSTYLSGSGCYPVPGFMDNQASSLVNNTPYQIVYFSQINCLEDSCYLTDTGNSYRRNLAEDRYTNYACRNFSPDERISSFSVY